MPLSNLCFLNGVLVNRDTVILIFSDLKGYDKAGQDRYLNTDFVRCIYSDFFICFELTNPIQIIHQPEKTGFEETRDFPIRKHDIVAGRYEILDYLGSAAFSRAVQCLDRKTGTMVWQFIIILRQS